MKPLHLQDQFAHEHTLDGNECKMLIITAQRESATKVKDFLLSQKNDYLQTHRICFIMNIVSVPKFLVRWIVIPKMKHYPFKVFLLQSKEENIFPGKKGYITAVEIDTDNKVETIRFLQNPAQLFQMQ